MDKEKLRIILKEKRNSLNKITQKKFDNFIFKNFLLFFSEKLKKAKNIMIYLSFSSEVNTKKIINFFIKKRINVYVPTIINNYIEAVKLYKGHKLIKGKYRIKEPEKKIKIKNLKNLDAIFIPGIGFDEKGNRIGFGKGYFDRFLKKINKKTSKIGLAYSVQLLNKIPAQKHDIKMNYIITEKSIIKCGNKKNDKNNKNFK